MNQHYTKNTVEVAAWCGKCSRFTPHRVDSGRKGPCLACIAKLGPVPVKPPEDKQRKLFG